MIFFAVVLVKFNLITIIQIKDPSRLNKIILRACALFTTVMVDLIVSCDCAKRIIFLATMRPLTSIFQDGNQISHSPNNTFLLKRLFAIIMTRRISIRLTKI